MSLKSLKAKVDKLELEYTLSKKMVRTLKTEKKKLKQRFEDTQQAQINLQQLAQNFQERAHSRIAQIVTRCFGAVFEDPYEFRTQFDKKRGRTEAKFVFLRDGKSVKPLGPGAGSGGGVVHVAAFALRLVDLCFSIPPKRRLVVLDEPFHFPSRDLHPKVRELMMSLARELNIQFVMVTHIPELRIGKVVELG